VTGGYATGWWVAEDGGPRRLQSAAGLFAGIATSTVAVRSRDAIGATMVIVRSPDEVFLHGHGVGEPTSWVERIDPLTLEPLVRRDGLAGGPTWPGGMAAHADGSLYVVFGRHAHRLSADLDLLATTELPRDRAHNSFVVLDDGHLVTKDFGGLRPGEDPQSVAPPARLSVLEPGTLRIVDSVDAPEPSVARLSADGDTVIMVGDHSLFRFRWDGARLRRDEEFAPRYRLLAGQTHGWDAVLALGAAWFMDDGAGAEHYSGTLRGHGVSTCPLHLVRVDLDDGAVSLTEVSGLPLGLIANPPLIDERRRIALAYDSGNGVLAAFDIDTDGATELRWRAEQDHAGHLLFDPEAGLVLTGDHDGQRMVEELVVRDLSTGDEIVRVDSGSPLQSVLFPAAGAPGTAYWCTFSTVSTFTW
jgi:hypothetical protein